MLFAVLKNLNLSEIPSKIDGCELRLDYLERINIQEIYSFIRSCPFPVLLTLRKASQGGNFKENEIKREKLIRELFALKPSFFDLEYDVRPEFVIELQKQFPEVKILCSYHNFKKTPANLEDLFLQIKRFPAFGYKIATFANSTLDALRMLLFVKKKKNVSGICMGKEGLITRILGPVVGNLIDYTSLEEPAAPGQLTFHELSKTYRYFSLNSSTSIYGLIGDPIEASIGSITHNAVMEKYDLNAVYIKMRISKSDLAPFFSLIKELPFKGLSVTMPLKEEVVAFLDENKSNLKVVNTLLLENQKIKGWNTDGEGAVKAIEKRFSLRGKKVILIGAGGASQAIVASIQSRGAEAIILNRTPERAVFLYSEKGGGLERLEREAVKGYDLLINATSEEMPIDDKWILPTATVMDIKSTPFVTPFLAKALEKGCQVIYGIQMFIHQAIAQDKIWFGNQIEPQLATYFVYRLLGFEESMIQKLLYSHCMI